MFYQLPIESVIKELKTDATTGLTHNEASKRLSKYGPNLLPTKKKPPVILKFFAQFKNFLIIILLAATVISFILGETLDALVIAAIVLLNSTIGFIQEVQAEKTLESLKQKEILYALVLRDERIEKLPFAQIVPGDVLILEEGAKIPADARVIESFSIRVDESILTGESIPVSKNPKDLPQIPLPLADRTNMIYKDTQILAGRGKAIVVSTGKETEMGKIALFLETAEVTKTPLTVELDKVGKTLTYIIGAIASVIFLLNYLQQLPLVDSLLVSISLSVAAIPEGLPAVVSIVLSLGVKRLAQKKTLVKKLPSVETLGAVKIIATDKTGTLTQNKINVVKISLFSGQKFAIEGEGYNFDGVFFDEKKKVVFPLANPLLESILRTGVLANNASLRVRPLGNSRSDPDIIGDTTEAALLTAAARAGLNIDQIKISQPRVYEVPFSSERKMMSVVTCVDQTKDHLLSAKGAPEVIVEKCNLTLKQKKEILDTAQKLAAEGYRNLAIAYRKISQTEVKTAIEKDTLSEDNLTYLGIVSMQDPLRPEVIEAISAAKLAGIRTIMITGDHKETAENIALQAGIMKNSEQSLTENDIAQLSQKELAYKINKGVNVFARISPMGKLKIVEAIKSLPEMQIAVSGDGVNDAPALSVAHIGIAMGKTGTDITREIADLVITDDNYATIVDAVREGRVIFANLIKFIRYLISCNLSEVVVVAAGVFFGTPLPLLPIQLLWINLVTDGLPALALGVDPPEFDVMKRPPRDIAEGILHKKRWAYMTIEGSIMGAAIFALFIFALNNFSYPVAQTMTFAALALTQLVHAFNNRSSRKSLFTLGLLTNKYLVGTAIISIILQILVTQTNWGNLVFKTQRLDFNHWLLVGLVALIPFFVVEVKKQLRFRILP
ncbi:cation-transporting P-type ATPase [Candidatus Gottesmanbacteria bacterium]|nr:cation-transporting P-type ATPase [Candidatus Gottesmanbacteria bacterium]